MRQEPPELKKVLVPDFRVRGGTRDCLPYALQPLNKLSGRQALAQSLARLEVKVGVEIGVAAATSAMCWLDANPKLHLTCIDPWAGRREKDYERAVRRLKTRNATIKRCMSMEALKHFEDESLDFLHIDGNHKLDFCMPDLIFWSNKVRRGGVIVVHDYCEFFKAGVIDSVKIYTHHHKIDPWYVTKEKLPSAFWQKWYKNEGVIYDHPA